MPKVRPVRLALSRRAGFNLGAESRAANGLPALVVTRPHEFSNPFRITGPSRNKHGNRVWLVHDFTKKIERESRAAAHLLSVEMYRTWIWTAENAVRRAHMRLALCYANPACWCKLKDERGNHNPCHVDAILEILNETCADRPAAPAPSLPAGNLTGDHHAQAPSQEETS